MKASVLPVIIVKGLMVEDIPAFVGKRFNIMVELVTKPTSSGNGIFERA